MYRPIDEQNNPLIRQHKLASDAPNPKDFTYSEFIKVHKKWLSAQREQNRKDLGKLFKSVRKMQGSGLFAFLSLIIHYRKEYDAYLKRGIDACTHMLLAGY